MSQILNIIFTIIAPIILVAGLGILLDRKIPFDSRTLSRLIIYLTSPALLFYSMANATMQANELLELLIFAALVLVSSTVIGWLVTRAFNMPKLTASAFVLAVSLTNIGNYGIPFNEFAFGRPGLERALVITVVYGLYSHSMGVFLASWGRASIAHSLKNVVRVPGPYAATLGLMVNFWHIPVPDMVMRVAFILQGAAVPLMLVLLGIQIGRVEFKGGQWGLVLGASALRLVGGAVIGWAIATLMGLQGVSYQVAIIEAAMPTAVIATILATEFESDAQLVSTITLVSTALSVITLSVLLYWLY
ncbi:MAG: AEC family transporter [Anaerolineae bacterium]